MRKIKIATLASTMPTGGAEIVTLNLFSHLDRNRFETEFYFLKGFGAIGEKLLRSGGKGYERLQHHRIDPVVCCRLAKRLRSFSPDILYMLSCHRNAMFWGALCSSLTCRCKRIIAVHHTPTVNGDRNFALLDRLFLPSTSAIVAVSPSHARSLQFVERIDPRRIVVIENGIDQRRYEIVDLTRVERLRAELMIGAEDKVVIMVAALRPHKGHETLLLAADKLVRAGHNFKFVIVGDGPRMEELNHMTIELGLQEHVVFLGERHDIPELLRLSDISVLPSPKETLPLFILESMAAGVPVIATPVGSVPDIIENDVNGKLVSPGDPDMLAEAIQRLARGAEYVDTIVSNAKTTIRDKYTLDRTLRKYEGLFERLCLDCANRPVPQRKQD